MCDDEPEKSESDPQTVKDGSLVNVKDLAGISKPATALFNKVSNAVGGIAKPWQIERVAKAEAKAEIIRAEARIEISEMEERDPPFIRRRKTGRR